MRRLTKCEQDRHGCKYCEEMKVVKVGKKGDCRYRQCPFDECQYKTLDEYASYEEYIKSGEVQII